MWRAGLVTPDRAGSEGQYGRGGGKGLRCRIGRERGREGGGSWSSSTCPGSRTLQGGPHLQLPCPHLLLSARCQWISLLWQGVSGHCGYTVRANPPPSRPTNPYPLPPLPSSHAPQPRISFPLSSFHNLPKGSVVGRVLPSLFCFCLQPLTLVTAEGWRGSLGDMDGNRPLLPCSEDTATRDEGGQVDA